MRPTTTVFLFRLCECKFTTRALLDVVYVMAVKFTYSLVFASDYHYPIFYNEPTFIQYWFCLSSRLPFWILCSCSWILTIFSLVYQSFLNQKISVQQWPVSSSVWIETPNWCQVYLIQYILINQVECDQFTMFLNICFSYQKERL